MTAFVETLLQASQTHVDVFTGFQRIAAPVLALLIYCVVPGHC